MNNKNNESATSMGSNKKIIIEIEGNRNYYENEIVIMKMMQSWKYRNAIWYV